MWKIETHQHEIQVTNQEVWLQKVGTKNNIADGLSKTVNQHVLRNMLTTLKIELLETSKEQLSINLIVCKNKLMGAEDSDASTGHKKILMDYRENYNKDIVMDYREKL